MAIFVRLDHSESVISYTTRSLYRYFSCSQVGGGICITRGNLRDDCFVSSLLKYAQLWNLDLFVFVGPESLKTGFAFGMNYYDYS